MLKNNKQNLIVSSLIILLPIIIGIFLWDELPQQMARHWGADGTANGYSSKVVVVFGMPIFMLALHFLCVYLTLKDPKNENQSKKVVRLIWWICPVICIFTEGYIYAFALGKEYDISALCMVLLGLMFVVFGNYFPKMKPNSSIGIRTKWTRNSEKNWYATHRVCSKLWITVGLLFILLGFIPSTVSLWFAAVALIIMFVFPFAYSYRYHKNIK